MSEDDNASNYSAKTDCATRPTRKRNQSAKDTPRPMRVPKKIKGPTREQVEVWRSQVQRKLESNQKKDNIMLSMAMSCRSSRKLTVLERLVSPFFVAALAIETNPFQFVINTSNSDVITIPPNKLRDNNWKIPQRCNLPAHMECSPKEAHSIVTTSYSSWAKRVEEGTKFFGIELGKMPPFGHYNELRRSMNFTTNILHQLWHAQVGSEEENKQGEATRWMKDNLSEYDKESEFEKAWKEKVHQEMEKKFMSIDGHTVDHPHCGNWKATRESSRKKKANDSVGQGDLSNDSNNNSNDKNNSSNESNAKEDVADANAKEDAADATANPAGSVGAKAHALDAKEAKEATTSSDPPKAADAALDPKAGDASGNGKVAESENEKAASVDHSDYVAAASLITMVKTTSATSKIKTTSKSTRVRVRETSSPPTIAQTNASPLNASPFSPSTDDVSESTDGGETDDDESNGNDNDEDRTSNNSRLSSEKPDTVVDEMFRHHLNKCGTEYAVNRLVHAMNGLEQVSVAAVHSHHYGGSQDWQSATYEVPKKERPNADCKTSHSRGGDGFEQAARDSVKALSLFLTACDNRDLVPPRWRWDYQLFKEMGTLGREDTDLKNRAMLVCLVLSAATRDDLCTKATAALNKYGLLEWEELTKRANYPKVKGAVKDCGTYKKKAKYLRMTAIAILNLHGGKAPNMLSELTKMRGIGRKTAILYLNEALGMFAGIGVDSHVRTVAMSLGMLEANTDGKYPDELHTESSLRTWVPDHWYQLFNRIFGSIGQMLSQDINGRKLETMAMVAYQCFQDPYEIELFWAILSLVRSRYCRSR